ncbi:MAG: hypothetical protein ACI80V_003195 [Rhodothermales bacterium]|jgi:hypothetical protein
MTGDVLFFDFAYAEFLPIIEEAASRGIRPIMNQPAMRQVLTDRGVPSRAFHEFAEAEDTAFVKRESRALGDRVASAIARPGAAQAFDSPKGNLLVSGSKELVREILTMADNQIFLARVMRRLIETTNLKALVMRSCLSSGQRALQEVAASYGIPVIELSHGNPSRSAALGVPSPSWHMAVFGERERDILVSRGADPAKTHVTGAAQWDSLYRPKFRPSKEAARETLGLPVDQPFVLLAGSFSSGRSLHFADSALHLMESTETFARALASLRPAPLVAVRPHPGESSQKPVRPPTQAELADYRRWFTERGVNLVHVDFSSSSLVEDKAILVRAADAVVVQALSSTMITEVLILDRPVFKSSVEGSDSFYEDSDGVLTVQNSSQLADDLDRIIHDQPYRESLRESYQAALPTLNHLNDGQAAGRVVDLIETLGSAQTA